MQQQLQQIDLTQREVVVPEAPAAAIDTLRVEMAKNLRTVDLTTGWTPAYSLDETEAAHTAEFLIYSALTTVARRPDTTWSWTENWPYEPEVGNTPTTNTFMWTWISFCFTFFAFGGVIFIYEYWLSGGDEGMMDPLLADFRPLTASQRKIGKYFLLVAAVLLLQILAGTIMAHAYYDRRSFYGLDLHVILPFNFLRDVHIHAPIIWIGVGWIGAGLFLAPAIAGGREARGQGVLIDILFWVTLVIVAGALIGDWLGIVWAICNRPGSGSATRASHHPLTVLADRFLRRPPDLERADVPRDAGPRRDLRQGNPPVLVRAHSAGEPDLGGDA
jgi:nitric oxide reductase subunit B